jgi:hypothetical protein
MDIFRRKVFLRFELKRLVLKSIMKTGTLQNSYKYSASFSRNRLVRASALVEQRNRCVLTGRI